MFKRNQKEEVNVLNEFMLGENEEREIRASFGKYNVYEMNDEAVRFMGEMIDKSKDSESEQLNIDEADLMINLLSLLTDLPEEILDKDTFVKIQNKPKKIFRKIVKCVEEVVQEYIDDFTKEINKVAKMNDAQKLYFKQLEKVSISDEDRKEKEIYEQLKAKFEG